MEKRLSGRDVSFDPDPEDDENFAPATYLPSPNSDPAHSVERDDEGASDHERLSAALAKLDERSRMILSRRWLAESKATLHELAAEYGVSAERIRQIEATAIGKLKKQLEAA
jgi:RNA polymerase sigma-32 factor